MTRSSTEGYQANGLHEATMNSASRGSKVPLGSTQEPTQTSSTDTSVLEREDKIQEDKIDDVAQENDTMHNPDMEIGKSYAVTSDDDTMDSPDKNPNEEYDYDDDKVRKSNVVA